LNCGNAQPQKDQAYIKCSPNTATRENKKEAVAKIYDTATAQQQRNKMQGSGKKQFPCALDNTV